VVDSSGRAAATTRRPAIAAQRKKKTPPSPKRRRNAARGAKPRSGRSPPSTRGKREQPLGVGVGDAFAVRRLGIPAGRPQLKAVREMSWIEFGEVVRELAARISDRFQPDLVLGVARGGIVVGGALASPLRAEFLPVRVEKRARDRRGPATFRVPEARGRRVLVVDDVTNSGATLEKARKLAQRSGAREVQTAALVTRPGRFRPDWGSLETSQLIVFPWDYQLGESSGPAGDPGALGV